jgi:hypothetical protein
VLKKRNNGSTGSCASPYATTNCGANDCSPHDVAYDADLFSGCFFVTLTDVGQVSAVKISSPSTRSIVYRDATSYAPLEHELAEDP